MSVVFGAVRFDPVLPVSPLPLPLQVAASYRADLNRAALAKYAALAAGVQKKAKQAGVAPKKKSRRA